MAHEKVLQVNTNFWPGGREFAFINFLKGLRNQFSGDTGPAHQNVNGYPTTLDSTRSWAVELPSVDDYSGNWILRWVGEATFSIGSAGVTVTLVSGSLSGVDGEWIGTIQGGAGEDFISTNFNISAMNVGNPLTNFYLIRADQEDLYLAGNIFNPDFLNVYRDFDAIRFLNWDNTNTNYQAKASHELPVDYYSYGDLHFLQGVQYGTTTNVGNDYTLSGLSSDPSHGDMCHVIFNADATDSPTLNGKVIVNATGGAIGSGSGYLPKDTTRWALCVFHTKLDAWIKYGGDAFNATNRRSFPTGVPFELQVALCNELDAHPWFMIPVLAVDYGQNQVTDLVTSRINYAIANLVDDELETTWEVHNEVFNTAAGFIPGNILANVGNTYDPVWSKYEVEGIANSLVGAELQSSYSGTAKTFRLVMAGQINGGTGTVIDPLDSLNWVAEGGTPAKSYVTDVAITTYWAPSNYAPNPNPNLSNRTFANFLDFMGYVRDYSIGTAAEKTAALNNYWNGDDLSSALDTLDTLSATYKTVANNYGMELVAYEGGYGPDFMTDIAGSVDPVQRIFGITKGATTVIDLDLGHSFETGMIVVFRGVTKTGGAAHELTDSANWTAANGYTITAADAASITLDVNSTSMGDLLVGGEDAEWGVVSSYSGVVYEGFRVEIDLFLSATKSHYQARAASIAQLTRSEAIGFKDVSCFVAIGSETIAYSHIFGSLYGTVGQAFRGLQIFSNRHRNSDSFMEIV